eukprot:5600585-Pyramimonas_sp.AAC.1
MDSEGGKLARSRRSAARTSRRRRRSWQSWGRGAEAGLAKWRWPTVQSSCSKGLPVVIGRRA